MEAPTAEIFVKLPAPRMRSMTMMMSGKEGTATVQTVGQSERRPRNLLQTTQSKGRNNAHVPRGEQVKVLSYKNKYLKRKSFVHFATWKLWSYLGWNVGNLSLKRRIFSYISNKLFIGESWGLSDKIGLLRRLENRSSSRLFFQSFKIGLF